MKNEDLEIGKQYKKVDLGITKSGYQMSEITVRGELFTFFYTDKGYYNKVEADGFVYECRDEYVVIPKGKKGALHRHVFLEEVKKSSCYTYLGVGKYEERYENKCEACKNACNKIFW